MLKIRLNRTGKKSQPSFRVVVQEHTAPVKGKFVEKLGFYLPTTDPKEFNVDLERVKYWMSVGAQPSDTVAALLKKAGMEGMDKYLAPRDKQRKKKKEVEEKAPAAEETPAEPAKAAEPAAAEEPVKKEAPAEEPAKAEEAAPAEEPAKKEAPAEEPAKAEEAAPAEEPAKAEEAASAEEPVKEEAPAEAPTEEPVEKTEE